MYLLFLSGLCFKVSQIVINKKFKLTTVESRIIQRLLRTTKMIKEEYIWKLNFIIECNPGNSLRNLLTIRNENEYVLKINNSKRVAKLFIVMPHAYVIAYTNNIFIHVSFPLNTLLQYSQTQTLFNEVIHLILLLGLNW